jgi:hypothetical protein
MHYRLYSLHTDTGGILRADDITAATDAEAIRMGSEAHPGTPFEIWCKARRVFSSGKPSTGMVA